MSSPVSALAGNVQKHGSGVETVLLPRLDRVAKWMPSSSLGCIGFVATLAADEREASTKWTLSHLGGARKRAERVGVQVHDGTATVTLIESRRQVARAPALAGGGVASRAWYVHARKNDRECVARVSGRRNLSVERLDNEAQTPLQAFLRPPQR